MSTSISGNTAKPTPGDSTSPAGSDAKPAASDSAKPDANGTKRGANGAKPYHHGHLREALVDAALATARAEGPGAVVLRAATRAVGVSPNAAYRHFADRDALLHAVAARCQQKMAVLMQARLDEAGPLPGPDGAIARLRTAGHAYVEFALTEPGWFATAFAIPLGTRAKQPGGAAQSSELYAILVSVLDELVTSGAIEPGARDGAEYVAWAGVHGIATLISGGSLRDLPPDERDAAISRVIDALAFWTLAFPASRA